MAQSGRAIEMMNQGLVWLADNLRVSYGDALLKLARMVVRGFQPLPAARLFGQPVAPIPPSARFGLIWPRRAATSEDRARDAQLRPHSAKEPISQETAVKTIADVYDIEDVHAELARIARPLPRRPHERRHPSPRSEPTPCQALHSALEALRRAGSPAARTPGARRTEGARRAGMVDLDGLKLVDTAALTLNDNDGRWWAAKR